MSKRFADFISIRTENPTTINIGHLRYFCIAKYKCSKAMEEEKIIDGHAQVR